MFCILEKDDKTFHYLKKIISYIKENKMDCILELDTFIQKGEILDHLRINGFQENDREEMCRWVEKHGRSFREYLNTMKIAAVVWVTLFDDRELTWEDFCQLEDKLNSKKNCLDAIHG